MSVPTRAYTVGPGQSLWERNPYAGADTHLLAGGKQSEGAFALVRYVCEEPIYTHIHDRDDESVYVLKGEPTVTVGDVDHALVPGSFIYMPRGVPHSIASDGPWEGLSVSSPGNVFDRMLEELGEAFDSEGGLDAEGIGAIMAKHGIRTLNEDDRWYGDRPIRQ